MDISHKDASSVLLELWRASQPAMFFTMNNMRSPAEPSIEQCQLILDQSPYIDYFCGRCIKCNFSNLKAVDPRLYDRDFGQGAFAKAVALAKPNE